MANYNTVITNEGAALLASVIANHGTITFTDLKLSENDYTGQETTMTAGTFDGVFADVVVASSIVDITTIKVSATVHGYNFSGDHNLYALGVIGTDGNTTALIAVCTTTNPDVLRDNSSTYAFNINLTVSSTSDITVVGTTAAVIYDTDIIDNLTSPATNKPLSANQGRLIADNLAANEESGAKNHADASTATTALLSNNNGVFTNTVADDYSYFYMYIQAWTGGTFISNIANQGITATGDYSYNITIPSGTDTLQIIHNGGIYDLRAKFNCNVEGDYIISFRVLGTDPRTIGGLSFDKVMLRDARILDPTFVPFAKTNQQLTADKAERSDLATLNLTGTTNSTGSTINEGVYFYLNGSYCKAITNIANGATFTLNTNFEVVSVGKELKDALDYSGVYIFNATPGYEGWGGIYLPTPLPIPVKLLSDYTVTISDVKIGRDNGADITIPVNANDMYVKTHGGTSITYTLTDYFQSASPDFASFAALRNANATILIMLDVAHT